MADAENPTRDNRHTEAWQDKPWTHFQRVVFRLQKRIYRAQQRHDCRMIGSKSIIRIGTVHTTGLPILCYFIATVMIRCTVPMTRAIRLRSCMIGNGHVQFCSGRRRGNPPPDRNSLLLGGHCGISYQALRTHFAADSHDSLSAFMTHRLRIEACITDLIRQGRFEEDETIVMRSHDMR
jgi:hypothetical protein